MSLKIVTGGTTGAADGTLVSSSNKIVFTALDTPVDCHMRADNDTYSADTSFTMPSDGQVQVSFDGGSTWKAFATNPNSYGADIGDLNVAIKLRQHAPGASSTGTFQTDSTTPASTALGQVAGLSVTPGNASNSLSWTALANRTYYKIERATNSGFTTGLTTLSSTATATTYSDTGLTNGTTYWYRVTGIGTVRYSDGAPSASANGTPSAVSLIVSSTFTGSDGTNLDVYDANWTRTGGTDAGQPAEIQSNRICQQVTGGAGYYTDYAYEHSFTDGYIDLEMVAVGSGTNGGNQYWNLRRQDEAGQAYKAYAFYVENGHDGTAGTIQIAKYVGGVWSVLDSYAAGALTGTHRFKFSASGTLIKIEHWNGSGWDEWCSVTDSSISTPGKVAVEFTSRGTSGASAGLHLDNLSIYGDA